MSRIVKGIFGGTSDSEKILRRFRPSGFSTAGATGEFSNGSFNVTPTQGRKQLLGDIRGGFDAQAAAIRGLRGQVTPGFGRLSQIRQQGLRSRLAGIRDEGRRFVGSIRSDLARRRLAGSSFQAAETARAEATVTRELDRARADANEQEAQAFLQEIGLSSQLIAQEFDSAIAGMETILQQMNLDTSLAAGLSETASQLLAANIQAQAEARAAQQAAGESFLDNIIGAFAPLAGGGVG